MKDKDKNKPSATPSTKGIGVWNDPELEARLVAMLMGELSPFEEAEMQQELEDSPELRLFRDRMIEVHGLISEVDDQENEAASDGDDEGEWKLSPERRDGLLDAFANKEVMSEAEENVIDTESDEEKEDNVTYPASFQMQRRSFVGVAACLLISLGAFIMMFTRRSMTFKSEDQLVVYSASSEDLDELTLEEDIVWANSGGKGRDKYEYFVQDESVEANMLLDSLSSESSGKRSVKNESNLARFKNSELSKKMNGREYRSSFAYDAEVIIPEITNEEKHSLSSPSSTMAEVIATNARSDRFKSLEIPAARGNITDSYSVTKPEMSNSPPEKPPAPLSTMGRVIAANRPGEVDVPVPSETSVEPSLHFCEGKDFGGGWGGGTSVEGTVGGYLERTSRGFFPATPATPTGYEGIESTIIEELALVPKKKSSQLLKPGTNYDDPFGEDTGRHKYKGEYTSADLPVGLKKDLNALMELDEDEEAFNINGTSGYAWKTTLKSVNGKLVEAEVSRRELSIAQADKDLLDGRDLYQGQNYEQAVEKYQKAIDGLPEGPIAADRRREYMGHLLDGSIALSTQYRRTGKYEDARDLLNNVLEKNPGNITAKKHMESLDDPIRNSGTLTYDHVEDVEKVRKLLLRASSYYDQAEFDRSNLEYQEILRIDPYNKAARRGMERVDRASMDYYRAAYDQTRSSMLREVDDAWETDVPEGIREDVSGGEKLTDMKAIDQKRLASIELFKMKRQLQEAKVEDYRDRLYTLSKKYQIPYLGKGASSSRLGNTEEESSDLTVAADSKTKFSQVKDDYERELAILEAIKSAEFSEELSKDIEMPANKKTKELVPKPILKPKKAADLSKEISAAEQTHSTFSLNVSDVSYQLVKAGLLDGGEMPQAEKIRVEEFVNAFDYGDPSVDAASGQKVNCVVEQVAHPFFQQRNLVRIGMKTGALGRSQPLRLTVLLDNSGSMERADRAATVYRAIEALADQLGSEDEVTLLSFARNARMVAQKVKGDDAKKLVEIVKQIPSEGGTNLSLAIQQAYATAQQSVEDGTMSRVVLITDGAANLGDSNPEVLAQKIEQMRQSGIAFDACGVGGDGLDDDMLEALTRKGDGRYYFINKPEDADKDFAQKLAGALRPAAQNVKVQVVFNPNRVGNYKLIGFEKHRLEKKDFRNDAVDAVEMAAEEAGNALYQVEVKPNGTGNVGTVFVRFRDMTSGQMVERSWAIPYQPSASNVHAAKPSMQLATLAGMLGERLKYGERSGIELDQLSPLYGKLRSQYQADDEVRDLIRMCEKLKR